MQVIDREGVRDPATKLQQNMPADDDSVHETKSQDAAWRFGLSVSDNAVWVFHRFGIRKRSGWRIVEVCVKGNYLDKEAHGG